MQKRAKAIQKSGSTVRPSGAAALRAKTSARAKTSLCSMTGFARASRAFSGVQLDVEIKSVNHRFLDVALKFPRVYSELENEVRSLVSERFSRGRFEVYLQRREDVSAESAGSKPTAACSINRSLFDALWRAYEGLFAEKLCKGKIADARALFSADPSLEPRSRALLEVLRREGVVRIEEEGAASHETVMLERDVVIAAIGSACQDLRTMREREGTALLSDLQSRLLALKSLHTKLTAQAQSDPQRIRERLTTRVKRLAPEVQIDPNRLAAEVALLADRADIHEELSRLASHFEQFEATLNENTPGRKLDFLLQEINRELNTIGSKCQDQDLQHLVVLAKVEVEKLREQVQNVE